MAIELEVHASADSANTVLDRLREKLKALGSTAAKPTVTVDTAKADANVGNLNNNLNGIGKKRTVQIDTTSANNSLISVSKSADQTSASLERVKESSNGIALALSTAFTGASVYGAASLSDKLTNIESRLKTITNSQLEFNTAFDAVRDISLGAKAPLEEISNLYSKMLVSTKAFGATQNQVALVTATVSKALVTGGASAAETSSAILQLGQAMGSGVLQGQELNAILESSVPLSTALAKGMNTTVGALKDMGSKGLLTSSDVFKAILRESGSVNRQFEQMGVTFSGAMTNIGNSSLLLINAFQKLFGPSVGGPAEQLNNFALLIADFAKNLSYEFYKIEFKMLMFGSSVITIFKDIRDGVFSSFGSINGFLSRSFNIKPIKLMDFFPDIKAMPILVDNVTRSIERSFFWLYDRVIGHSWVPDLVDGILFWFSKLTTAPVNIVTSIVRSIDFLFKKAAAVVPVLDQLLRKIGSSAGIDTKIFDKLGSQSSSSERSQGNPLATLEKFGSVSDNKIAAVLSVVQVGLASQLPKILAGAFNPVLIKVVTLVTAISGLFVLVTALFEIFSDKAGSTGKPDGIVNAFSNSMKRMFESFRDNSMQKAFKGWFDTLDNGFIHTFKQLFGLQDKVAYAYADPNSPTGTSMSDPNAAVGKGKDRNNSPSTFQNIVAALPISWQVPALTALAGVALAAVTMVFKGSAIFPAMLAIVGLSFGTSLAKGVDGPELIRSFGNLANTFLKIIQSGMDLIFQGKFNNPFGLLAIIAKLSLMMDAGRKGLAETLLSIATAPTAIGKNLANKAESYTLDANIKRIDRSIGKLQGGVDAASVKAMDNLAKATTTGNTALIEAARLNVKRAQLDSDGLKALNAFSAAKEGTAKANALVALESIKSQMALAGMGNSNIVKNTEALNANRARLAIFNDNLKSMIEANRAKATESMLAVGGALGGLAGSYLGFQIGRNFSETVLSDYSGWAKAGVALGMAMVGQLVGAFAGSAFISALSVTVAKAGAVLLAAITSPLVWAVAAIAAALYVAFNWDTLQETFTNIFGFLKEIFSGIWGDLKQTFVDIIADMAKAVRDAIYGSPSKADTRSNAEFLGENKYKIAAGGAVAAAGVSAAGLATYITSSNAKIVASQAAQAATVAEQNLAAARNNANLARMALGPLADKAAVAKEAFQAAGTLARPERALAATREPFFAARNALEIGRMTASAAAQAESAAAEMATALRNTANVASRQASVWSSWTGMIGRITGEVETVAAEAGPGLLANLRDAVMSGVRNVGSRITYLTTAALAGTGLIAGGAALAGVVITPLGWAAIIAALSAAVAAFIVWGIEQVSPSSKKPSKQQLSIDAAVSQIPTARATGGFIAGPGTGTSDSIPAMLSNGEFVINAKATAQNRNLLERINSGDVAKFADGGLVTDPMARSAGYGRGFVSGALSIDKDTQDLVSKYRKGTAAHIAELTAQVSTSAQSLGIWPEGLRISPTNSLTLSRFIPEAGQIFTMPSNYAQTPDELAATYAVSLHELGHAFDFIGRIDKTSTLSTESRVSDALQRMFKNSAIDTESVASNFAISQNRYQELAPQISNVLGAAMRSYVTAAAFANKHDTVKDLKGAIKEAAIGGRSGDFTRLTKSAGTLSGHTFFDKYSEGQGKDSESLMRSVMPSAVSDRALAANALEYARKLIGNRSDLSKEDLLKAIAQKFPALKGKGVSGFATGGFISGPGSGTSDSIPAMLSNGEFVINAEAAKKNANLLHAINNGSAVGYFSKGLTYGSGKASSSEEKVDNKAIAMELATKMKLSPVYIQNLYNTESGFDSTVISSVGATGVGQLMPKTAKALGLKVPDDVIAWQDGWEKVASDSKISKAKAAAAAGPMPIHLDTDERFDPKLNMQASIKMIDGLRKQFGERYDIISAAYNAGPGAVKKNLMWNPANQDLDIYNRQKQGVLDLSPTAISPIVAETKGHMKSSTAGVASTDVKEAERSTKYFTTVMDKALEWGTKFVSPFIERISNFLGFKDKTDTLAYKLKKGESLDENRKSLLGTAEATELKVTAEQLSRMQQDDLIALAQHIDALRAVRAEGLLPKDKRKLSGAQIEGEQLKIVDAIQQIAKGVKRVDADGNYPGIGSERPVANTLSSRLAKLTTPEDVLKEINTDLTKHNLKKIDASILDSDEELAKLITLLDNLATTTDAAVTDQNFMVKKATKATLDQITEFNKSFKEKVNATLTQLSPSAMKAGVEAASTFGTELTSGIASAIRGDAHLFNSMGANGEIPSVFSSLLNTFTKGIMDTAISSFTKSFMKNSGIDSAITKLFGNVFDNSDSAGKSASTLIRPAEILADPGKPEAPTQSPHSIFGSSTSSTSLSSSLAAGNELQKVATTKITSGFGNLQKAFTDPNVPFAERLSSGLDGIGSIFSGGISGLLNMLVSGFNTLVAAFTTSSATSGSGGLFGSIISLFSGTPDVAYGVDSAFSATGADILARKAEGGLITGPGTDTSDSIPAMLSNGEFVVNSKATRKFSNILQQINSGRLPHYATGGLVGSMPSGAPITALGKNVQPRTNASIINLNITGDISRQTRGEIYKMLPHIADGVNQHNKERNYRG